MSDSESPSINGYGHEERVEEALTRSQSPSANGDRFSEDDADLFGDGGDTLGNQSDGPDRKLDDSELDSGDEEGRADRLAHTVEDDVEDQEEERREVRVMPAQIARIQPPEADELYLLNMPPFLGLSQKIFDPAIYEPPTKGHGADFADANFSPFSTASTSLHWRRDPKDSSKLLSNSRIIRWSDGSLTLQIASSPKDQYKISTQALRQSFGKKSQKPGPQMDYDPSKDAQFYLAAEHAQVPALHQIVAPLDAALKIMPTGDQADESVLKLQQSLAAATNVHDPLTALKQVKEDPELAKKAAEMFEKDRLRSTRRRERAEESLLTRKDRVLGRAGLGRGGLSVAGLEDEDGMPTARASRKGPKTGRRRVNRHGEIYSDDEDDNLPRGRTREDEYDLEDDFMAASDEEPEIYDDSGPEREADEEDDDPDVDDLEIEGRKTVVQGKTRGGERDQERKRDRDRPREKTISRSRAATPKRALDKESGSEGDRAGAGSPQARKKRRVIDDDEEDE